jgi:pimeloyl-ACP methyl ester carboxylesterase
MKPETNYAKSGDVYIAYQVNGSGPFDLVWAPGTFSHLDMDWEFPMRADFFLKLGTICRLIRFDKRGTGLSDRPTQMATLEQRTDDIRAVMDAVGLESAVSFVCPRVRRWRACSPRLIRSGRDLSSPGEGWPDGARARIIPGD